ncbi:MAG: hypothetical protein HY314_11725 [Acidobacteria bacterium]|nr:hypothetical protein [Acidobacteriota bacterium]
MKKLLASFTLTATPILIVLLNTVPLPSLCLVLFLIFPPLVLLCLIPGAGLLPLDFATFL